MKNSTYGGYLPRAATILQDAGSPSEKRAEVNQLIPLAGLASSNVIINTGKKSFGDLNAKEI